MKKNFGILIAVISFFSLSGCKKSDSAAEPARPDSAVFLTTGGKTIFTVVTDSPTLPSAANKDKAAGAEAAKPAAPAKSR